MRWQIEPLTVPAGEDLGAPRGLEFMAKNGIKGILAALNLSSLAFLAKAEFERVHRGISGLHHGTRRHSPTPRTLGVSVLLGCCSCHVPCVP
jgi:hypothetical protein